MDRENILAGEQFEPLMLQAVDQAQAVILILSPEALASRYVQMEYQRALSQQKLLIPLLYRAGGNLPDELARLNIIDGQHISRFDQTMLEVVKPLRQLLRSINYVPPTGPNSRPLRISAVIEPTNMPRPTQFVGRAAELQQITTALQHGNAVGVCALQGMGGIGKSALAALAVDALRADPAAFAGGAAWISAEGLTGESGLDTLMGRIAFAMDFDDVAQMPTAEQRRALLIRHLAQRPRTLLAIDNLEPGLPADILVPALTIPGHTALLLTARHHISANLPTQLTLPPLPETDAGTLLRQRLHQADQTRPTPEDLRLLPAVAQLLDGLPLALEVTAAYVGGQKHSMQRVLDDLQAHHLQAIPVAERLHVCFQRSWQVLTASQQALFAGMALLAGTTFLRAAAEALAPESTTPPTAQVDGLVALALVEALPEERLRLHPFLRDYAQEQLQAQPPATQEELGDRMVGFWQTWSNSHRREVFVMEAEAESLLGAVAWAHEHDRYTPLIQLVKSMARTWDIRGRWHEAKQIDTLALSTAQAHADLSNQRWFQHELAVLDGSQGRNEEARAGYQRALELARQLGNLSAEQVEVHSLAVLDGQQGRNEEARAGYQRALELARQLGDLSAERAEVHALAVLDADQGRNEEARAGYQRALELARQLGDQRAEAFELMNLGSNLGQHGQPKEGYALIEQALTIFQQLGALYEIGRTYQIWAYVDEAAQDNAAAITHYQAALRYLEQVGAATEIALIQEYLRALGVSQ
jgi:tetratricopeptide (TPR) repeat protein